MAKTTGVETDFRQQEPNTEGLSHLLEDLPSCTTIEAYLIAANESGEAEQTVTVSAVVP